MVTIMTAHASELLNNERTTHSMIGPVSTAKPTAKCQRNMKCDHVRNYLEDIVVRIKDIHDVD